MGDATAAELLDGVRRGDEQAWAAVVDRYAGLVWSVVLSVGLDRHEAADVSQTVWLRLAEHGDRIRDAASLPAWLATTARHEAIRLSKAARRRVVTDEMADVIDLTAPVPGERLEDGERLVEVRRAFNRLGAACQELLRLLTADPRPSYDEVAALLGRPVGSLGPTRARCLDQLRRHLADVTGEVA